jgi:hypothetical protein
MVEVTDSENTRFKDKENIITIILPSFINGAITLNITTLCITTLSILIGNVIHILTNDAQTNDT